nr:CPPV343 ankyrin repeat protein [Cooks petrelpox virus]
MSFILASAPNSNRILTAFTLTFSTAQCKGVLVNSSTAFTLVPKFIKAFITSGLHDLSAA